MLEMVPGMQERDRVRGWSGFVSQRVNEVASSRAIGGIMQDGLEVLADWSVSADATLQTVIEDERCPALLRETRFGSVTWQNRTITSVSRAIQRPRIVPQWLAALLALGASVRFATETDDQTTPVEQVLRGTSRVEILSLHVSAGTYAWCIDLVARTPTDDPIVAAVATIRSEGTMARRARAALTGVWKEPVRLARSVERLAGDTFGEDAIDQVAAAVAEETAPESDFRGSAEYRSWLAHVLTRRALESCWSNLRNQPE
jgi:CO/xanthine dehydrogenase FAD-binding subunit